MTKPSTTSIPQSIIERFSLAILVGLLLLAWGLRLCRLESVPPGWRDDELINIHAISGEPLAGHFPLYFTEASGHEPIYHYLHAGIHAVLGFNVLSGHILSVACGILSIALTYALTRRLFEGHAAAILTTLATTTSFWSLMYSRTAIRHIILPPFALATCYVFWSGFFEESGAARKTWLRAGLILGASLYTYYASRLLPVLLLLFAAYLMLFHRQRFRRRWRGFLLSLMVMLLLVAPLGIAIARGRSVKARQGVGADARLDELAAPLRELKAGNPRPVLDNVCKTLGMFHATGDPEWLYNIANRPVFNIFGGILLWASVALALYRWRQPRYFFLLLWLGLGIAPAFFSVPPASLSHTILAQPVAYILPTLVFVEAYRWIEERFARSAYRRLLLAGVGLALILFLASNAIRDLRDYFIDWPQRDMVRLLYRADYRAAARYLDADPDIAAAAVASALRGPWDRLALDVDIQRQDVAVRLFNPERALVWIADDAPTDTIFTTWPSPGATLNDFLETGAVSSESISSHLAFRAIPPSLFPERDALARFTNGMELIDARWEGEDDGALFTFWRVAAPLDLPSLPIVSQPPPPNVYAGPRLAVFAHLVSRDGILAAADDGLWVDPLTLQQGDRLLQIHRFTIPADAPSAPYTLELGLYDPMTRERWRILDSVDQPADRLLLPPDTFQQQFR